MATGKKEVQESQIGLITEHSQTNNELCLLGRPQTLNSVASPYSSTDAIIMRFMTEDNDIKPVDKRLGSWWDNAEEYNELSSVFLGAPKPKHDDSWFSSAKKPLNSLFSTREIINIEDDDEEETLESERKKPRLGLGSFCDDSSVVKGSSSKVGLCFSSTDPHEKKTKNDERLVPSQHDSVDLCENESVGESTTSTTRHVTLEDLSVTVEDLKSIPWEAFDSTWEIRSKIMDPWLGGYVEDMDSLLSSFLT